MTSLYWNNQSDVYQYKNSTVLKNLADIRDQEALEVFEQRASILRIDEVITAITTLPINLELWKTIHKILFQDVYSWSGKIRTVQLAKGNTVFAMPEHIESQAQKLFEGLNQENIQKLDIVNFRQRLAYYFAEMNVLHPFREGNGRTQKLLFDEIARRSDYFISWERIEVASLLEALIIAFNKQDYSLITSLFAKAVEIL